MDEKKVIDTMASAVVSAIQENNKINIEPKLKDVKTSVNKPDNQKEGDIWLDVQQTDSGSSEIENLDQTKILDMFYPVGSIYQSTNNFIDPNIKFGGTWQKLENCFLFGSSNMYPIGSKGGSFNDDTSEIKRDLIFSGAVKTGNILLNNSISNYRFLILSISEDTNTYTFGNAVIPIIETSSKRLDVFFGQPSYSISNYQVSYSGALIFPNGIDSTEITIYKDISNVSHRSGYDHWGDTSQYIRYIWGIK